MKRFIVGAVAALALSACGGGQTDACKKYVACSVAVSPDTKASVEGAYGPSGTCWQNSATADSCDKACVTANTSYATAYPDKAECK